MPGDYKIALSKRENRLESLLVPSVPFTVTAEVESKPEDRRALLDYREKVTRLQKAFVGATEVLDSLTSRIGLIKQGIQDSPKANPKLRHEALEIESRLREIDIALRGDNSDSVLVEPSPVTVSRRIQDVTFSMLASPIPPTGTRLESYKVAAAEFGEALTKLRAIATRDFPALERKLDAAGVPHTPGRLPDWRE